MHVSINMPEIEVHACGEDRKDKGLQTRHAYSRVRSVKIDNKSCKCVLFEEGVPYRLGVRNISDSVISTGRSRTLENITGARTFMPERTSR